MSDRGRTKKHAGNRAGERGGGGGGRRGVGETLKAIGAARAPNIVAIIPARLGSTRFPGKVLADKTGMPLIVHVCQAAAGAKSLDRVIVATDDARVMEAARAGGFEAVLTSAEHANGTSRLAEAASVLRLGARDIVVNVQGDEPEIEPAFIDAAVRALRKSDSPMATVGVPFAADEDAANPNLVKVVVRADGQAMYFSRALIPFRRDAGVVGGDGAPIKHVGLYVYRRPFLKTYLGLAPAPSERAEMLEQLRALHHGHGIAVAICEGRTYGGIDTPEQYEAFVARWRGRGDRE